MKSITTQLLGSTFSLMLSVALLLVIPTSTMAKDSGKAITQSFNYGGKSMLLNGVGVRKKLFLSMYTGSLYLTEKSKDAAKIIADDAPMAIRLVIISSLITKDKMKKATQEGFEKATNGNIAAIKPQIDELMKTFDKELGKGDVYEFINMPGSGVHVVRNGIRVSTIRSLAFKQALFGIWLSKTPVQKSLKRKMLGM